MKSTVLFLCLLLLSVSAISQTLPGVSSIEDYWPEGEQKQYTFFINEQKIGRLSATHTSGGDRFCSIEEALLLDLASIGLGPRLEINNSLTVYRTGHFMSANMDVTVNGETPKLSVLFDSSTATARAVLNGDNANPQERYLGRLTYLCDNNMIDQLEMALAFQDIIPGDSFTIPVFLAQSMSTTEFSFTVVGQTEIQYGSHTDSVWQLQMTKPAAQVLYLDETHDLVKIVDTNQNLKIEYQRDSLETRDTPILQETTFFGSHIRRLPLYGLYLLICAFWLLFLGHDSYRSGWSYALFGLGGIAFAGIYITQVPLQQYYAINVLTPIMQSNGSVYLPATIPAIISGLVQETLKIIPLLLVALVTRPRAFALISLGAFVGAGFGFIEASHITGPLFESQVLSNLAVFERTFAILFHVVSGALLGYGIALRKWWIYWLIAAGLHALGNYLILFAQMQILTVNALEIILSLYDILLLTGVFIIQRNFKRGAIKARGKI